MSAPTIVIAGFIRFRYRADAGDRAAGPDPRHEHVDLPVGLLPDLRSGRLLVRLGIDLVEVLVRLVRTGDLLGEAVGDRVVRLRGVARDRRRGDHDLGPVGAQERDLLLAHLVRHHEDAAVAADRGGDRETVTRVAGGRLDDRAARTQQAPALGVLDHPDPDPVLHRAARVQHLELREDRGPHPSRERPGGGRAACCPSRRGTCRAPASAATLPARPAFIVPRPLRSGR